MKILIILPYFPYPLSSGGNIANFEMINHLRFHHQITMLTLNSTEDNIQSLQSKWDNVEIITYSSESSKQLLYKRICKSFLHLYLSFMSYLLEGTFSIQTYLTTTLNPYINPNLVEKFLQIQKENSFDFIQIEFYELLPLINYINDKNKSIFIHHELRFVRYQRSVNMNRFNQLMINLIKGQEIELLKQYAKVVTVSDVDRQLLERDLSTNELVSSSLAIRFPNKKLNSKFIFNNTLTFLGGSEHFPNKDAIYWFLENCWENVLEETEIKLNIIGAWSNSDISRLSKYRNVSFLGFVEDLESALCNSIMIVPIRIGSGMRMKIIEAANYGVPFITTTVGVEGLDFRSHFDCLIADTPESFVQTILNLQSNAIMQNDLIHNAYNTINTRYNSNKLFDKRNEIYK
jgi:glycosyltransferase involved in cell wall biosynthesis